MAVAHALFVLISGMAGIPSAPDAPGIKGPRPAIHRSGSISGNDYPASALRDRAEGVSDLRYLVGEDGRVLKCFVARSSGNRALDSTACSLLQRRFRYRPAVDAAGRPVSEWRTFRHTWSLPSEDPPPPGRPPASG